MIELSISFTDSEPLYEQIYKFIRSQIKEGKLLCEERLPSTRSLAEYLQISRTTVDMAYDQLVSEGYIEPRPYKGYFVCDAADLYDIEVSREPQKLPALQISEEAEADMIDFSPRTIDMSMFPYSTWRKITRQILVGERSDLFSSGVAQGDEHLRDTIARYLRFSRGVNLRADNIIVGAGNDYLLMLLGRILRFDKLAMEKLTYTRAGNIFESLDGRVVPVGIDDEGIDVGDLTMSGARLVYVMPAHQYPTGIVMSASRRRELLKWAYEDEGRYIIEDDYDSEFRYRGRPIPSLQASDKRGRVIYMGTFSKAIAPSIRISYMVLPDELMTRYHERCSSFSCTVSRIDQTILDEFIRDGYFERHLNKMRHHYRDKHDCCLQAIAEQFEEKGIEASISGDDAGLHFLITFDHMSKLSDHDIERLGLEHGVRIYPLSDFTFSSEEKAKEHKAKDRKGKGSKEKEIFHAPTIIVGFAALSKEEIIEGARRLSDAILGCDR